MRRAALLVLGALGLVWLLGSCGATSARADEATRSGDDWRVGDTQSGKAVWYGGKHHGGPTASGERFDKRAMTAAHRTLPMGSVVRVTNLKNDRQVTVRINDRGPYGKGRIIDVSEAAAKKLDMIKAGVVPATVEVLVLGKKKKKKKKKPKRAS
ncbi:MAG TPA: septal ring lytic transglycosylase RlpA family protein [Kofleriaceae bacterium]|nr:septal ring lytic transglycosylase RlpA family protein [Kofleriaceae bacterium]